MHACIPVYACYLIHQWTKAFGEGLTLSLPIVEKRIKIIVKDYYNRVYVEHSRKTAKKKNTPLVKKSLRMLNQKWKESSILLSKTSGSRKNCKEAVDKLLDIRKNI